MRCRHCNSIIECEVIDLGFSPPSNNYLNKSNLSRPETSFPLRVLVCESCWLVQTEDYVQADDLFAKDYAYFSSTSTSWLRHAESYAQMMIAKEDLDDQSLVIELASNDGYLLQYFKDAQIPCLGVEPTKSTAEACEKLGIDVIQDFFDHNLGAKLAAEGMQADLIVGNNVFAHVPDINSFTKGIHSLLKPDGCVTLEFPHVCKLLEFSQFDTIYHEHYSYLSLHSVMAIFTANNLRIFDLEEIPTHGGSLRVYGCSHESNRETKPIVVEMIEYEREFGILAADTYTSLKNRAEHIKNNFLTFLLNRKKEGKSVAGFGAAAKGNTLINYAGIKSDLMFAVYDSAEAKQGKYLPGSHIPVYSPSRMAEDRPDCIVILPWNIKNEVVNFISEIIQAEIYVVCPEILKLN